MGKKVRLEALPSKIDADGEERLLETFSLEERRELERRICRLLEERLGACFLERPEVFQSLSFSDSEAQMESSEQA